jgi:signal transduction histidine kinase
MWCGAQALFTPGGARIERDQFPCARALREGSDFMQAEVAVQRPDGTRRRVSVHPELAFGDYGEVIGVVCVMVDVTDFRRVESQLEWVDKSKQALLSMLSHELRNPLSPMLSMAQALRRDPSAARALKTAEVVERQVTLLGAFLSDVLDASGAARDHAPRAQAMAGLNETLALAGEIAAPLMAAKGQRLCVQGAPAGAAIVCDLPRLALAIGNLLLNAAEFSPEQAEIDLRARVNDLVVEIEVEDHGIGIERGRLPGIFQPHAQAADGGAPSGLGLSIAKAICLEHGGAMRAESNGVGAGSRFVMVMPIALARP